MNIYRIRLSRPYGGDKFWASETMNKAIDLAFNQWLEDRPSESDVGVQEHFWGTTLLEANFIGELENDIKDGEIICS